jgi:methylase of polypeptide subunit release factors
VLGISLLLQNPNVFHDTYFSDISPEALEVAKKNYKKLIPSSEPSQPHFLQANLADFLPSVLQQLTSSQALGKLSITLVANLPYIPDETFDTNALENVQKREPRIAFVGGNDGLDLYRTMFNQIKTFTSHPESPTSNPESFSFFLESRVSNLTMFLEMMTRQVEILKAEFGDWLTFEEVQTFHFNIRIIKATLSAG